MRVVVRVVFEVGVLDDHHVALYLLDPVRQAAPLPWFTRCLKRRIAPFAASFFSSSHGAVGGAVVHHDDLFVDWHSLHPLDISRMVFSSL